MDETMDIIRRIYLEASKEQESASKSVTILRTTTNEDGSSKIELDEEAIKTIFERPRLADLPVMLLSVSGAFRKGKSFMLNFLLRYMRNKGYKNSEWLGKENLNDGFSWRGGKEPDTQGILIYDEAFVVNINGKETAVFLMDTQGLFDNNSDKGLCAQIFAFSTLLSSVQVFNLSQHIQENDLEYLQCFTKYAEVAKEESVSDGAPFQKLVFVVRDWQDLEDHDYGLDLDVDSEGNKGYLDGVLSCVTDNEELTSVRKHLRESFSELDCFLMPHPGLNVAISRKKKPFTGAVDELSAEFIEEVRKLADFLMHPKHGVQKTINGREITCSCLVNYAIACGKSFASGEIPQPQTMLQNAISVMYLQTMNASINKFRESMEQKCRDHLEEEAFKALFEEEKKSILEFFNESVGYQASDLKENYRMNLISLLRIQYDIFNKKNHAKAREILREVRERADSMVKKYASSVDEAMKDHVISEEDFKSLHEKCQTEVMDVFVEENKSKFGFNDMLVIFKQDLQFAHGVLQRQAIEKLERSKIRTEGMELMLQDVVDSAFELYKNRMHEFLSIYVTTPTHEELHTKAMNMAREKYSQGSAVCSEPKLVQLYLERLISKIDKEHRDEMLTNASNKKFFEMTLNQKKNVLIPRYLTLMTEGMRDNYVLPGLLLESHKRTTAVLMNVLTEDDQIKQICWDAEHDPSVRKAVRDLRFELEKSFNNVREANEKSRSIFLKTSTTLRSFFTHVLGGSKKSTTTYL